MPSISGISYDYYLEKLRKLLEESAMVLPYVYIHSKQVNVRYVGKRDPTL